MRPETKALVIARCAVAGAALATVLATFAAMSGRWTLWAVNGVLFLACAACAFVNYGWHRYWRGRS